MHQDTILKGNLSLILYEQVWSQEKPNWSMQVMEKLGIHKQISKADRETYHK